MKNHTWVALGLFSLITILAPTAEAGRFDRDYIHFFIPKNVLKQAKATIGPEATNRLIAWNELIVNNRDKPVAEKLKLTNEFFNRIPLKPEKELWGHPHWSTPFEMVTRNGGGHADHVIGKYMTLAALGISVDQLQMTHVHSVTTSDQSYMVLTYRSEPNTMPLVLDTLNSEIILANERNDLSPEDSLNENGTWRSKAQKTGFADADADAEASEHVKLWHEMNARMDKELSPVENTAAMLKVLEASKKLSEH